MSLEHRLLAWCQQQKKANRRPVVGLNGPVGAGKSTLSRRLQELAAADGLRLAVASIDDAYLPWQQRLQAMAGNPYGVNRVPPGSHDPEALVQGIRRWRGAGQSTLELPRFDKTLRNGAGDRVTPWQGEADVVLLEGWLLGCRPLVHQGRDPALIKALIEQLNARFTAAECDWVSHCDQALQGYQGLWRQLDHLLMLWPADWSRPRRWRYQAEASQRRGGGGWLPAAELDGLVKASLQSLPPQLYQRPVLAQASWVRVLDGRRRSIWEGSGEAAQERWTQSCSVSSSATG